LNGGFAKSRPIRNDRLMLRREGAHHEVTQVGQGDGFSRQLR
jgi:hypothetical protein